MPGFSLPPRNREQLPADRAGSQEAWVPSPSSGRAGMGVGLGARRLGSHCIPGGGVASSR